MENDYLDLPDIKNIVNSPKTPSMNEIDRWIEEDYSIFFNKKTYQKEKKRLSVYVPFKL